MQIENNISLIVKFVYRFFNHFLLVVAKKNISIYCRSFLKSQLVKKKRMPIVREHNLSRVRHIVAIAAGKGGVGKSTLALNAALYFQKKGCKVGLMDADLYGPSLQKMLPEELSPAQHAEIKERIVPAQARGIKLISMAYFLNPDHPTSVRAPIANGVIKQFIHLVDWGELDFLIIDFPPGTGDIQLTLVQEAMLSGAVIVTTPQEIALLDVSKSVAMFHQMQVPLVGVVENMSGFMAGGKTYFPFGEGGGERFANENALFFLGAIPIETRISECCDNGKSLFDETAGSPGALAIASICEKIQEQLESFEKLTKNSFDVKSISKIDQHRFTIEWSDGRISDYRLSDVQRLCPCARCRGKNEGECAAYEDVEAVQISKIGGYALQIIFTKGCSKGIYPFQLLRQL